MRFGARQIAGLCNGSTPDSDSVCEGSNPSPAAMKNTLCQKTKGVFQLYSPTASYIGYTSYICFASDIGLRPVLEANIISLKPVGFNITFTQ